MKRTRLVWIVDCLCAALPDRIPTHYGADGVIDGYGRSF